MSEKKLKIVGYVWYCLNCKEKMSALNMKDVNQWGECPYCKCRHFEVEIYELVSKK